MSKTNIKLSSECQQDRSDVLSLLNSIDGMCDACQHVLNTYTQTTLMLAITTEAKMLLMKLQVMKDRWNYHLPFKEASGVDFYDWSKRFEEMSLWMTGNDNEDASKAEGVPEYCPSKHFLLDLYTLLPENKHATGGPTYYRETNTSKLISIQEHNLRQLALNWKDYKPKFSELVVNELEDQTIGEMLRPLVKQNHAISKSCSDILMQLSKVLNELHNMPNGEIRKDQFVRLAERVINEPEYGGVKAQKAAKRDVNNLKNTTPEDDWPSRRDDEINVTGELISEMKHGGKLFRFMGHNYIIKDHYAGFGRFLNTYRKEISEEELTNIIEYLFRIHYLREDIEQQEIAAIEEAKPEEPPAAAKDALAIYQKRKAAQPRRPRLSYIFSDEMVSNVEAVNKYYEVLHRCGFFIGRTLLREEKRDKEARQYTGWKWRHLMDAYLNMGFIRRDFTKRGFANHIASVFPYLTADSVLRSLSSRSAYDNKDADRRYVSEIEYEFKPVTDLMKKK